MAKEFEAYQLLKYLRLAAPSGTNGTLCSPRTVLITGHEPDPLGLEVEDNCRNL